MAVSHPPPFTSPPPRFSLKKTCHFNIIIAFDSNQRLPPPLVFHISVIDLDWTQVPTLLYIPSSHKNPERE